MVNLVIARKGFLDVARSMLTRVRVGISEFVRELAEDASGLSSRNIPTHLENGLPERRREAVTQRFITDYRTRANELARRLADGELNVAEWRAQMSIEVRTLHVAARVSGAGGFGNLSDSDITAMEQTIRDQLNYLNNWASQLERTDMINQDQVTIRANLYGGAANTTFSEAKADALGLPRLPFQPARQTECRTNCGCQWEIVELEGNGNYDVYWRRHKNDSCTTCIARERACNPLKIRGGSYDPPSGGNLYAN